MQNRMVLIACVILIVFTGCSSTGSKITRSLLISSEPTGATVYLDGDKMGETPLKFQTFFTWNGEQPYDSLLRRVVRVKKEGYAAQSRDLYPIDMPNIMFFLESENAPSDVKGGVK